MTSHQIPNPDVLILADEFADAAAIERGLRIHPRIMCGAFAVELYLKSLLARADRRPVPGHPNTYTHAAKIEEWVHPLTELRDLIIAGHSYAANFMTGPLEPAYKGASRGTTLRETLTEFDDAFTAARYSFEAGKRDRFDGNSARRLMLMASFLRHEIGRLKPVFIDTTPTT